MESDGDQQAEAMAAEWGVDVGLFDQAKWTIDVVSGNDGEIYGYLVSFDDDETPPEVLTQLGLRPGELTRQLKLNAFDKLEVDGYGASGYGVGPYNVATPDQTIREDDEDDALYSIDEPLPDISEMIDEAEELPELPPGQAYLTDGNHRVLADKRGRGFVVDVPTSSGAIGGAPLVEHAAKGAAYAGASFAGNPFATSGTPLDPSGNHSSEIEALRYEMHSRLDALEGLIRDQQRIAPLNRGHNQPPELLEIEQPIAQNLRDELIAAISEIREESANTSPSRENIDAQVSVFQRVAKLLKSGSGWLVSAAASGIVGDLAMDSYKSHQHQIYSALANAAEAVISWAQHLPSTF